MMNRLKSKQEKFLFLQDKINTIMIYFCILLAGLIWAIWYFNTDEPRNTFKQKKERPINKLKSRLALGEITKEQFKNYKEVIESA
ncbi:MAG: putative membrane protein [Paraglaciecola sp.]|jgi:uncharacterized membrane protein